MKKYPGILISGLCILILLLFSFSIHASDSNIYYEDNRVESELSLYRHGEEIFVRASGLADLIDAEINWISTIDTLELTKKEKTVKMRANSPYIQITDRTVKADEVALKIVNGSAYIPLKEVVRAFGYITEESNDGIYIKEPSSYVKEINWRSRGRELVVEMNEISPYRIKTTEDSSILILEIDGAVPGPDFSDRVSDSTFYLETREIQDKGRLQVILNSRYPIPFHRDAIIEESGNNIVLNFHPRLEEVIWDGEELRIKGNDKLEDVDVSLLYNPRRIVIDIPGLMLSDFKKEIYDNDSVENIRVSQFKLDPLELRLVVDIKDGTHLNAVKSDDESELLFKPVEKIMVSDLTFENNTLSFLSDNPVEPNLFTLSDPERLVIDIVNAGRNDNISDVKEIDGDLIKKIRTSYHNDDMIRIVADLNHLVSYNWEQNEWGDKYRHKINLEDKLMEIDFTEDLNKIDVSFNFSQEVDFQLSEDDNVLTFDFEDISLNKSRVNIPEKPDLISDLHLQDNLVELVLSDFDGYELLSESPAGDIRFKLLKTVEDYEDVIIVDPGHGGFDPGAVGKSGLTEKEVVLDIGLRLRHLLENEGYKVVMTREDDEFLSLQKRVEIANQSRGRLFVSLHCNSSTSSSSSGTEVYVFPDKSPGSRPLAEMVYEEMLEELQLYDRGVKEDNFYVIKHTEMPAILVEAAFLSNSYEESLIKKESFRREAADAIYRGIINYLNRY